MVAISYAWTNIICLKLQIGLEIALFSKLGDFDGSELTEILL